MVGVGKVETVMDAIKSGEKGDGGLRVGHQVIMSGEYLSMINH